MSIIPQTVTHPNLPIDTDITTQYTYKPQEISANHTDLGSTILNSFIDPTAERIDLSLLDLFASPTKLTQVTKTFIPVITMHNYWIHPNLTETHLLKNQSIFYTNTHIRLIFCTLGV